MTRLSIGLCGFLLFLSRLDAAPVPPGWEALEKCTLIADKYSDGDSFYVMHKGRELLFRLYFVDCPETDNRFPKRLDDQAEDFGLKSHESVIAAGKKAEKFAQKMLSSPFTVLTKWEDARGASSQQRFYAVLMVGGKNFASEMVRNGWARAYGMPADFPDKNRSKSFREELRRLQAQAIRQKLGAFTATSKVLAPGQSEVPERPFIDHESDLGDKILKQGIIEINSIEFDFN
jgi:endonuclease YncB( thermonuclease family)